MKEEKEQSLSEYLLEATKAFESLTPEMLPKGEMPRIYSDEDIEKFKSSK